MKHSSEYTLRNFTISGVKIVLSLWGDFYNTFEVNFTAFFLLKIYFESDQI